MFGSPCHANGIACSTLMLSFSPSTIVTGYDFTTASDASERDPISWELQCREDESAAWVLSLIHISEPTRPY